MWYIEHFHHIDTVLKKQCEKLLSIISGGLDTWEGGGVLSLSINDTFLLSCFVTDWTIVYR